MIFQIPVLHIVKLNAERAKMKEHVFGKQMEHVQLQRIQHVLILVELQSVLVFKRKALVLGHQEQHVVLIAQLLLEL